MRLYELFSTEANIITEKGFNGKGNVISPLLESVLAGHRLAED